MEAVGNNALPYRTFVRWVAGFQRACATSGDLECSRWPVSVRNDVSRAVLDQYMESDSSVWKSILHGAWLTTFFRPMCYNSRAHCPLLQCLRTTSAILADAHSYFVVSSFKCERKNSSHDLIPNPRIHTIHRFNKALHKCLLDKCYYSIQECFSFYFEIAWNFTHWTVLPELPNINNGAHGTEKLLLNTRVSEDFSEVNLLI